MLLLFLLILSLIIESVDIDYKAHFRNCARQCRVGKVTEPRLHSCSYASLAGKLGIMQSTDDTQPLTAGQGESRPHAVGMQRPKSARRGRRLLLAIILTTSCTLVFTLALFARAIAQIGEAQIGDVQVTIERDGVAQLVSTRLETVGELLSQLELDLPENAAVSHSASDNLVEGMVIRISPPREVTVIIDGDERQLQTPLKNPWDILTSAGIALDAEEDKIWVNGALADFAALPDWTVPAQQIRIRRAARLTVIDDGVESSVFANAETIGDALAEAGIKLHPTDQVTPALDTLPSAEMTVHIKRALPLKLHVDGVTIEARSNAANVGDALVALDAPLFGLDYVRPPAETAVSAGMTIEIVRVVEDIETESEAIDFTIKSQLDDSLNLDDVAVLQDGRAGTQENRYRVRYENGIEAARELIESVVVEAPMEKIIAYGSRIAQQIVDTPLGPRHYWRRLCVYATSYNPESNGGLQTATGATLAKGIVAAKPHIIPYHTQVFVPKYGLGVVRDTGAGPRSTPYWIDLGYSDHDWVTWGGYTWVYLLAPPPDEINYDLPPWAPVRNRAGGCSG